MIANFEEMKFPCGTGTVYCRPMHNVSFKINFIVHLMFTKINVDNFHDFQAVRIYKYAGLKVDPLFDKYFEGAYSFLRD